ncbi:hypothetical protein CHLRE_02g084100v5 [Chlamydomonas reinhardtii]|uniref:RNI-like protein n=1 Tax=Chlamydomonas reinhardtii TaxID=3055 RepID=A8I8B1_CHLRE|nr:uncharacterized protein CHLRE_02g084100v5 [Chlamydomonas reinhardtii]PNW86379.1 hypothetical protein CHLRE_02g084100v5 [Chlamydomonas reinhardtii]|eukprot:XP_001701718.1 predicted protein [Chlamydomonas reinhardtii]
MAPSGRLNPAAKEFVPQVASHASATGNSEAGSVSRPNGTPGKRRSTSRRSHVFLTNHAALDQLLVSPDASCISAVTFGAGFHVRDEHLRRLADALGSQLRSLRLGDTDTGDGVFVTDEAVKHVASKCPGLEELALEGCVGVSDAGFTAVLSSLSGLRELHLTGHDRSSGMLTCKGLSPLINGGALPNLRQLYITDQMAVKFETVQRLIRRRKDVQVLAGETDGDSAAWGAVLQQMGRSYGDGLYGNMCCGGRMR